MKRTVNPKWYGTGQDYKVNIGAQKDASLTTALIWWQEQISLMKQWGFNIVRLSFRFPASGTTHSVIVYDDLDAILNLLSQNGLLAILSLQNWNDMQGFFGSPEWIQSWVDLANRFKGDTRIRAYELFNEPYQSTWHSSVDGGGDGIGYGEGVMTALAQCVDAIRATGDNHTIVYPDPWFIRPTDSASALDNTPIPDNLKRPNIVVGFHLWQGDPSIYSIDYTLRYRAVAWMKAGWSIYVGEMGVLSSRPWSEQKQWCIDIINYMLTQEGGFNFWMHEQTNTQAWQYLNEILEASNYVPPTPTPPPAQFTLSISSTTGGTTNPSPGSYTIVEGQTQQVTALPDQNYRFVNWLLNGSSITDNPILLTINQNYTLTAIFEYVPPPPITYKLTVGVTAGGTTVPSPGTYTISADQTEQVVALPSTNYRLVNWFLDGVSRTENPISVIMNQDHILEAVFEYVPPAIYNLFISSSVGGSTSPSSGQYSYPENTSVNIQATAQSGYFFDHWDLDGVAYTSNPITVLMNKDHSLVAYFSPNPPPPPTTYKLGVNATTGGTTNPLPGIYDYTSNTAVMLTATPTTGYIFDHWELDGNIVTPNPLTIVMDKDHLVLAVFTTPHVVTAGISPWLIGGIILVPIVGYLMTRKGGK